jgi:hypothetical protein
MIHKSYKDSLCVSLLYSRKQKIHIHHFLFSFFMLLEFVVVSLGRFITHRLPSLNSGLQRLLLILDVTLEHFSIFVELSI